MFREFNLDDSKMHSAIRMFKLSPMEGKGSVNSTGLIDKRLFTGENKLLAYVDPQSSLWAMKYEKGITPQPLQQRFTGINKLKEFVTGYFAKRNVLVEEIVDAKTDSDIN